MTILAVSGVLGGCGGGGAGSTDGGAPGDAVVGIDAAAGVDAANALDAGGDAPGGSLPLNRWTWVPVEGAVCGNGTPTGLGANPAAQQDSLLIYMMGGGACWDALTCFVLRAATHLEETYGAAALDNDVKALAATGLLDRSDATSPFAGASWVMIPYCTGDLHFGHMDRTYNPLEPARVVHHRGADNVGHYLRWLAGEFPAVKTVWLTGSSAGGYGATLNHDRVQAAFPTAAVHLLADSAQMITPGQGRWPVMRDAWGATFAAACTGCREEFPAVVDYLARTFPQRRLGLLAYDQDQTIGMFWGYSAAEVQTRTNALVSAQYAQPNTKAFVLGGTKHVMLLEYATAAVPGGTTLKRWIAQWAAGDPAWANAR